MVRQQVMHLKDEPDLTVPDAGFRMQDAGFEFQDAGQSESARALNASKHVNTSLGISACVIASTMNRQNSSQTRVTSWSDPIHKLRRMTRTIARFKMVATGRIATAADQPR